MNEQRDGSGGMAASISDAAGKLMSECTGRGPTHAKTTISEDLVTIVLGDTLTKGERALAKAGRHERVMQVRHEFQMLMREALIRSVEGTLGREVAAFMSTNHIDPDLAVEVFVLEPRTT